MKRSVKDKIRWTFVLRNMPHYCNEDKSRIGSTLPHGEVLFEVGPNQVECRFIYKRKISPEKQDEVLEYLRYKNNPEWEGEFEMEEDGTVSYRIHEDMSETKDVEFGRLTIMRVLATKMGEETAENMSRIADGTATAKEMCQEDD